MLMIESRVPVPVSETILIIGSLMIVIAGLAFPVAYCLGYAFSCGYHRAKREFVKRLIQDNEEVKN